MRKTIAIGVVAAMAAVLPGAAQGRSGVRHGQGDVACRYQRQSCTTDSLI